MPFTFGLSTEIQFGVGAVRSIGELTASLGGRTLVVTGGKSARAECVLRELRTNHVTADIFTVSPEPTVERIEAGVAECRRFGADVVIGFGGGSALDAAKVIAALVDSHEPITGFLEVIGGGAAPQRGRVPCIAIPTTAGSGAEVTRNAVLRSERDRVKVSIRGPGIAPAVAIVDPALTVSMPAHVTASTGLDALTQLIEPYLSPFANPFSDALAERGIRGAANALPQVFANPRDLVAREAMSLASLTGGIVLSNSKLGAVHALAGALGGHLAAPHGALCGRLLPHVLEANVTALMRSGGHALQRCARLAVLLTGVDTADPRDAVAWLGDLVTRLRIPGLGAYGLTEASFSTVIEAAQRSSSVRGNPVPLTDDELSHVLAEAL